MENIGKYFVVLFFISHADNQRALHITLNDYKMDEIIIDCSVFVMSPLLYCIMATHMKARVIILIEL